MQIGNTNFKHFVQSNSQIKQKSFWFIAEELGDKDLLNDFGNFEKETVILKKMAR